MMDTTLAEIRAIEIREMELEREREELRRRRRALLDLDKGPRKTGRNVLTPAQRKALLSAI